MKKLNWDVDHWSEDKQTSTHILKVDADKHPDLVKKYKVEAFPTFIKLEGASPVEVDRRVGYQTQQQIQDLWSLSKPKTPVVATQQPALPQPTFPAQSIRRRLKLFR